MSTDSNDSGLPGAYHAEDVALAPLSGTSCARGDDALYDDARQFGHRYWTGFAQPDGERRFPPQLFRFFKEPQWADKLASGEVFLSTLERCRQYEDPLQGDPGEGIHVRGLPDGYAVWGQPGAQELAAAHNFHLRPGSNIVFRGNTERVVVPDGWLLCLTTEDTPAIRETFGHHGVVINDPWRFFRTIHRSLSGNPSVWFAVFGPIIYEERSLPHVLEQPIHAMVKPEQYQHQAEVRMFWHPTAGTAVTEMTLNLPGAARYMTRLPNL